MNPRYRYGIFTRAIYTIALCNINILCFKCSNAAEVHSKNSKAILCIHIPTVIFESSSLISVQESKVIHNLHTQVRNKCTSKPETEGLPQRIICSLRMFMSPENNMTLLDQPAVEGRSYSQNQTNLKYRIYYLLC